MEVSADIIARLKGDPESTMTFSNFSDRSAEGGLAISGWTTLTLLAGSGFQAGGVISGDLLYCECVLSQW